MQFLCQLVLQAKSVPKLATPQKECIQPFYIIGYYAVTQIFIFSQKLDKSKSPVFWQNKYLCYPAVTCTIAKVIAGRDCGRRKSYKQQCSYAKVILNLPTGNL